MRPHISKLHRVTYQIYLCKTAEYKQIAYSSFVFSFNGEIPLPVFLQEKLLDCRVGAKSEGGTSWFYKISTVTWRITGQHPRIVQLKLWTQMHIPYPISHIPETSNPSENRHSAAKRGWEKTGVGAGGRRSYYTSFFFFYCLFKSFNWRIIDLQCGGGCCRTTFISRVSMHPVPLEPPSHIPAC